MIQPSRRGFISGLAALIVAPAIVKASSLMPIKIYREIDLLDIGSASPNTSLWLVQWGQDVVYRTFYNVDGSVTEEVIRHPRMSDPSQRPRLIDTTAVWRGLPGGQQHG